MLNKRDLLHPLLLFLAVTILLAPAVFTGNVFFLRDITYLFHPWKTFSAELIQKGAMALWNPYAYSGMPLMANAQSAVFYPFSLLFYFFSFSTALKIFYAAHLFIAGSFAYLFARRQGLSRWSAAVMMAVFALNGYMIARLEFVSLTGTVVWLFAALLFVNKPVPLALALCFAFLSGHQAFIFLVGILIVYWSFQIKKENFAADAASLSYAFLLAFGLAAVQFFPLVELIGQSARSQAGIDRAASVLNSLEFKDLLRLATPLFSSSLAPVAGGKFPWSTTMHIGIIGACLAAGAAALNIRRKTTVWALSISAAGIILSLGDSTPVYPWLYDHVPLFRLIRYPAQFIILTVTGLTVLAGSGADIIRSARFKAALAAAVLIELVALNYDFQALAPSNFFHERSSTADTVARQAGGRRFILSPGTELDRRLAGTTPQEAWQSARGYLYNLTSIPYHIANAYGSGEPLTTKRIEDIMRAAYAQNNADTALPYFSSLGVASLVCRNELPRAYDYALTARTPWFIYAPRSMPELFFTDTPAEVNVITSEPGRNVFTVQAQKNGMFIWKEIFYPGWELYINGRRGQITAYQDIYPQWRIPEGRARVDMLYRPLTYRGGLAATILFLSVTSVFGIIQLRKLRALKKPAHA